MNNNKISQKDTLIRRQVFLDGFMGFPLHYGGWAISEDYAYDLVQTAFYRRPEVSLDLGGGTSTILMAKVAQNCEKRGFDMHIFSVDHDRDWLEQTKKNIDFLDLEKYVTFVHAPLVDGAFGKYYDLEEIERAIQGKKISFLSIDGPLGSTQKEARYPALPFLRDFFEKDAIVMLDDGAREEEQSLVERWKQDFPDWDFIYRPYMKGGFIAYPRDSFFAFSSSITNHLGALDFQESFTNDFSCKNKEEECETFLRERLDAVENSKSFRLGNLFFRSMRNPWKIITFPINLLKILFEKK